MLNLQPHPLINPHSLPHPPYPLVSSVGRNVISVIVALTDGLLLLKPFQDSMEEVSSAHMCQHFASGIWRIYFQYLLSF